MLLLLVTPVLTHVLSNEFQHDYRHMAILPVIVFMSVFGLNQFCERFIKSNNNDIVFYLLLVLSCSVMFYSYFIMRKSDLRYFNNKQEYTLEALLRKLSTEEDTEGIIFVSPELMPMHYGEKVEYYTEDRFENRSIESFQESMLEEAEYVYFILSEDQLPKIPLSEQYQICNDDQSLKCPLGFVGKYSYYKYNP